MSATGVRTDWYRISTEDACAELGVDPARGLEESEVVRRREQYGRGLELSWPEVSRAEHAANIAARKGLEAEV